MKAYLVFFLFISSVLQARHAYAEGGTCPSGYYPVNSPGVMGCAPMNGGGNTFLPPSPGPKWQTRWGAIAWGGGGFGASNNLLSKRNAEKSAVDECRLRSPNPKQCKVYTAYYNQCIAVAQGENSLGTARSPEINEAKSNAVEACRKTGDLFCKSAYDACSYPVRIR